MYVIITPGEELACVVQSRHVCHGIRCITLEILRTPLSTIEILILKNPKVESLEFNHLEKNLSTETSYLYLILTRSLVAASD